MLSTVNVNQYRSGPDFKALVLKCPLRRHPDLVGNSSPTVNAGPNRCHQKVLAGAKRILHLNRGLTDNIKLFRHLVRLN